MFAINQRIKFKDGQYGVITYVLGGGYYGILTDTGCRITVRNDELTPVL